MSDLELLILIEDRIRKAYETIGIDFSTAFDKENDCLFIAQKQENGKNKVRKIKIIEVR